MGQNERPCKNVVRLFASAPFLHILGSTFFFFFGSVLQPGGPLSDPRQGEKRRKGGWVCVWEGGERVRIAHRGALLEKKGAVERLVEEAQGQRHPAVFSSMAARFTPSNSSQSLSPASLARADLDKYGPAGVEGKFVKAPTSHSAWAQDNTARNIEF